MAIEVKFEGFVNEVKQFSWGTVIKVAHSRRAKNDATGEWETVGKDYFDVTLPDGEPTPAEGSIIRVVGNLSKVDTFEKRDGTTGVALKVRAFEIEPVDRRGPVDVVRDVLAPAGVLAEDVPF